MGASRRDHEGKWIGSHLSNEGQVPAGATKRLPVPPYDEHRQSARRHHVHRSRRRSAPLAERVTERLPRKVESIKPHPHGIHLGTLQRMCTESTDSRMTSFLYKNFSGVSTRAAKELLQAAEIAEKGKPKTMKPDQIRALLEAFQGERQLNGKAVKLLNPPTNCLSPIEELLIKKGLSKTIDSRFVTTMTMFAHGLARQPLSGGGWVDFWWRDGGG